MVKLLRDVFSFGVGFVGLLAVAVILASLFSGCDDGSLEMAPPAPDAGVVAAVCRELGASCQRNDECCGSEQRYGAPPLRRCSTNGLGGVGTCVRR